MSRISDELKSLTEHQKQIKSWLSEVQQKISTMEESYLEDTTLGNVVRGWEVDGKAAPLFKMKGQEDKERIFSNSSYSMWLDRQNNRDDEGGVVEKRSHHAGHGKAALDGGGPKHKKVKRADGRKRKHDDDLDYEDGDY